jgi:HTH-like domain
MRRIDELHLDYPFAGGRMLRDLLRAEGVEIGRQRVARMMQRLGIEALYRRPNTLGQIRRGLAASRSRFVGRPEAGPVGQRRCGARVDRPASRLLQPQAPAFEPRRSDTGSRLLPQPAAGCGSMNFAVVFGSSLCSGYALPGVPPRKRHHDGTRARTTARSRIRDASPHRRRR